MYGIDFRPLVWAGLIVGVVAGAALGAGVASWVLR